MLILRSDIRVDDISYKTAPITFISINTNQKKLTANLENKLLASDVETLILLEWNGKNIHLPTWIENGYNVSYNEKDDFTFGTLVLSKLDITFNRIDPQVSNNCPYPILVGTYIKNNTKHFLYPIHAPPPVPYCDFSTKAYLSEVSKSFKEISFKKDVVTLIGDFNAMQILGMTKPLKGHQIKDLGSVFDYTWRPFTFLPAMAKIDRAFTNYDAELSRFKVEGSDHYGLLVY
ncbi:MAG: hypothetical protein AAGK97_02150 [Bacteroidota bacterium]